MLRANKDAKGQGSPTVQQLAENKAAPANEGGAQQFAEKQSELEINSALGHYYRRFRQEKRRSIKTKTKRIGLGASCYVLAKRRTKLRS